ncbi:MAG: class I SAM-dependent methyltransferase, partial [Dehalococcoidia bacterium]
MWKFLPQAIHAAERQKAEKEWHEQLYRGRKSVGLHVSPRIKKRYLHVSNHPLFHLEKMFQLVGDVRGRKILCFGCGDENSTVLLILKGAEVWAFDLSFEAIRLQRQMAVANGVEDRLHPVVCAAEELPFADACFDIVFGSAILHHLPDSLPSLPRE